MNKTNTFSDLNISSNTEQPTARTLYYVDFLISCLTTKFGMNKKTATLTIIIITILLIISIYLFITCIAPLIRKKLTSLDKAIKTWEEKRAIADIDGYIDIDIPDDIMSILIKLNDSSSFSETEKRAGDKALFNFYYDLRDPLPFATLFYESSDTFSYLIPQIVLKHYIKDGKLHVSKRELWIFQGVLRFYLLQIKRTPHSRSIITPEESKRIHHFFDYYVPKLMNSLKDQIPHKIKAIKSYY